MFCCVCLSLCFSICRLTVHLYSLLHYVSLFIVLLFSFPSVYIHLIVPSSSSSSSFFSFSSSSSHSVSICFSHLMHFQLLFTHYFPIHSFIQLFFLLLIHPSFLSPPLYPYHMPSLSHSYPPLLTPFHSSPPLYIASFGYLFTFGSFITRSVGACALRDGLWR